MLIESDELNLVNQKEHITVPIILLIWQIKFTV